MANPLNLAFIYKVTLVFSQGYIDDIFIKVYSSALSDTQKVV